MCVVRESAAPGVTEHARQSDRPLARDAIRSKFTWSRKTRKHSALVPQFRLGATQRAMR